jgi:aspartate kinase
MGKTTNALEQVLQHYMANDPVGMIESYTRVADYHVSILRDLFPDPGHFVFKEVGSLLDQLRGYLRKGHLYTKPRPSYDFEYDQIVSYGELISSVILHHFLCLNGIPSMLADARELVITDAGYRDARVNWEETQERIGTEIPALFNDNGVRVVVTQGFIGCDPAGNTTTLGREGSDFTAAIFAYSLRSGEVTIWKDVPGVMNADPKWFPGAKKLASLSYREAIELAYYGASVIHPKTIKPLENAGIRLLVRSFLNPGQKGTVIENLEKWSIPSPIYIRKPNQVLISISPRDFSFIMEENLGQIFSLLAQFRVKANVMQNSAISFSVCIDRNEHILAPLIEALSMNYAIRYNYNVELFTIRHYNGPAIRRIVKNKTVLLEQKTRNTVHLVVA